ncbi:MAG: type VI secretion protein IcmF/TssM N-terminal domain-containing protein [Mariniblastus sp.]|nr:type VI secretion protein IcmF/TssM N-terminal domain-containing protein [Mariniblastus sp.]
MNQYIGRFLAILFTPFAGVWGFMRRVIPGLRKLPTLRPEVLAALMSFIFLMLVTIVHTVLVYKNIDGTNAVQEYHLFKLILLSLATPLVIYFGVRVFLAPPKSPFPDIDLAFEAGLEALNKNGIQIKETPLYLVLGMPDGKMIKHLMGASGRSFDFTHATADGQAMHWYGAADQIYVFLTGIGNVSQLTKDLARYINQSSPESEYSEEGFTGTIDVRALGKGNNPAGVASDMEPVGAVESGGNFSATIKPGDLGVAATPSTTESRRPAPASTQKANTQRLSSREKQANQKRRLKHVCELLHRHRNPVCALNGIVVCMASRLVEEFPGELARQVKNDLSLVCETTKVVSTVTAIVNGFENYEGCRELVFRLSEVEGKDFTKRRFGKSYRSWENPSVEHLKEISNESVENFDQYIYSIFTHRDALSSRHVNGNRNMVKFLCWIYAKFYEGLETTLTTGFHADTEDFPRFTGCYFVGVGESNESSFFASGVFDRIDENQGELEWTSPVLQKEETLSLMSQLVFLAGLIAFAVLIFLVFTNQ